MAYSVFATGYGQPSYYNSIGPTWFSIPLVSGLGMSHRSFIHFSDGTDTTILVTFAVQLFYARRLLLLSRSKIIAGLIVAVIFPFPCRSENCLMTVSSYQPCSLQARLLQRLYSNKLDTSVLCLTRSFTWFSPQGYDLPQVNWILVLVLIRKCQIWNGGGALCDVLIVTATTHYVSLHISAQQNEQS